MDGFWFCMLLYKHLEQLQSFSEARCCEVMDTRIPNEAPVCIILNARQRHICCRWHVRNVEPESDVCKCRSLDFVQGARVPKPERKVRDLLFGRPRMDHNRHALVRDHEQSLLTHPTNGGAHAVDEANILSISFENSQLQKKMLHL